jgi:hypothetical protein
MHPEPETSENAEIVDSDNAMSEFKNERDATTTTAGTQRSTFQSTGSSSPSLCSSIPTNKHLGPPPLSFDPWTKKTSIIVCTLGLLFFDLVLPCIIYYTISACTDLGIEINLGISCASLGLGELMELPLRGYRLYKDPSKYAPLGQNSKWGFDFLFWWYLIATVIGIVPYVISTCLEEPVLWLFLMTPGLLVGFVVLTAAVSAVPFRLPFRVSSDDRGERCKPFVYYVMEDFIAVDAGQMRIYREELRARWNASPVFRRLLWDVNMWWTLGGSTFIGGLAGMTWGLEFNLAYGLSFGMLFAWIGVWALGSIWMVRRDLRREREWFNRNTAYAVGPEGALGKELDIV